MGKKREEKYELIRRTFSCPASAPLREKLERLAEFRSEHPEYSASLLAEATSINKSTLTYHLFRSKGLDTQYEAHREAIRRRLNFLVDLHGDDLPGITHLLVELRYYGINTTRRVLRRIMLELGLLDDLPSEWDTPFLPPEDNTHIISRTLAERAATLPVLQSW